MAYGRRVGAIVAAVVAVAGVGSGGSHRVEAAGPGLRMVERP